MSTLIHCVEDDASILDIETYALKATGFAVKGFSNGADFLAALRGELPALVLLDVMLPGELDGVALLKRLRADERTRRLPVIMATAKGSEYDKIQSLDLGADDYLVKPFGVMEMVARVRAVLRRCAVDAADTLGVGALTLDVGKHLVTVDGERVSLTLKEFALLRHFLAHRGTAFTRDQLFNAVWGDSFTGETRTVDMHIKTLRQKLGEYGARIETVRGLGYRFQEDGEA